MAVFPFPEFVEIASQLIFVMKRKLQPYTTCGQVNFILETYNQSSLPTIQCMLTYSQLIGWFGKYKSGGWSKVNHNWLLEFVDMSEDWTGFCEDYRVLVLSNRCMQIASFKFSESVCNFFPTLRTYDHKQPNHKLGNKMANSLLVIFGKYRGYLQMQNSYSLISLMENCVREVFK